MGLTNAEKARMLLGSIILAGGGSTRMGQSKEALHWGETTLLGRVADMLLYCTHPVLMVAGLPEDGLPPLPLELEVVRDEVKNGGPFAAMATGIRKLKGMCDAVLITACDMPFLDQEAVAWLSEQLGDNQLAIPQVDGKLQPMAAIYRMDVLPEVEKLLETSINEPRKLAEHVKTRILTEADLKSFDPEMKFIRSVNTRDEYEAACRVGGMPVV